MEEDVKRGARETETGGKKAWRGHDGEDLADKIGNAGDEIRKDLGNAGDELRRGVHEGEHEADDDVRNPERRSIDDPDTGLNDRNRPM